MTTKLARACLVGALLLVAASAVVPTASAVLPNVDPYLPAHVCVFHVDYDGDGVVDDAVCVNPRDAIDTT